MAHTRMIQYAGWPDKVILRFRRSEVLVLFLKEVRVICGFLKQVKCICSINSACLAVLVCMGIGKNIK